MTEPHETFFESGILFGHFHLDPELRCAAGHAFWNYPSGKRWIEGRYTLGVRSGLWREYSEDGEVSSVTELGDGEYAKATAVPALGEMILSPETTLLLVEELGFRRWFWFPDRPMSETLAWWRSLFSVEPWFYGPAPLPGVLVDARAAPDQWQALEESGLYHRGHLHEDDDSWLETPAGERVHPRAFDVCNFLGVA